MKSDEKFFEALCTKLASDYTERSYGELSEEGEQPVYGKEYTKKIRRILRLSAFEENLKRLGGTAAVFIVVSVGICAFNPRISQAVKSSFTNTFYTVRDKYISIDSFTANVDYGSVDFPSEWKTLYVPSRLPSGYAIDKLENVGRDYMAITYVKGDNSLSFTVCHADAISIRLDSVYNTAKPVKLEKGEGVLSKNGTHLYLNWKYDGYDFTLRSNDMTEDEIIKIADSVIRLDS